MSGGGAAPPVRAPVKETMFEEMARKVFFCPLCCGISTYALQEEKREAGKIKSGITRSLRLEIDSSSFLTHQLICTTLKYQTNMTSSCHIPSPPKFHISTDLWSCAYLGVGFIDHCDRGREEEDDIWWQL